MPSALPDPATAKRVGVYGSCVGRDSVEVLRERGWALSCYVPRQSLVSGASPAPPQTLDLSGIDSAFVRRVLAGDVAGDMYERLAEAAASTDVLLWDIIDERLGYFSLPGDGAVTRTMEGLGKEIYAPLKQARLVEMGTEEHLECWKEQLSTFTRFLKDQGLWDKTLLLLSPWALKDAAGNQTPSSWGTSAVEGNWLLTEYYAAARDAGAKVLRLPDELCVAGTEHQWGLAPFHYVPQTYAWVADAVERFAATGQAPT